MRVVSAIGLLLLGASCSVAGTSTTKGSASHVKPASEGGQKCAPQEQDDDLKVDVSIVGQGTFDAVNGALCTLTNGDLSTKVTTTGKIGDDGSYESNFETSEAGSAATNPLCGALKNAKLTAVTSITLDASMPANEKNCSGFCQAKADDECDADADVATCTADAKAACQTQCAGSTKIKGSGQASASAVGDADSSAKNGGDINTTIDLVFTELE
jgi:hypothetical protein